MKTDQISSVCQEADVHLEVRPDGKSRSPGASSQKATRKFSALSRRLLLAGAFLLILLVGGRSWTDLHTYHRDTQWVEHTREVLRITDEFLGNLRDAETGQRGYLLTGQDRYLEPYENATAALPRLQRALWELTADEPRQQKRLPDLDRLVTQKLTKLATTIRLRRSNGLEAALAVVRTDEGMQIMDEIRHLVRAIKDEEYRLLQTRQKQARRQAQTTNLLTFSVVLLLFLVSAVAVFFIERDISHRESLERSLRMGERRLALALEAGRSGAFDWDLQNGVNLWSEELLRLYGLSSEQLVHTSKDWIACIHPEDRTAGLAALEHSLKTGGFDCEFRIRRHDNGEIRWMHGRAQVCFDESGKPTRMIGTNVDITERKRAEEALRASEERLTLAQAAAQIGTWDWSLLTDEAICSVEYGQLYGRPEWTHPLPFGEWLAAVHPEDRERAQEEVRRALQEDAPYNTEYRVIWPDGTVRWLVGKGRVFRNAAGQPVRMIGVNYDITERKRTAEVLASQTERLYEINQELERFAYAVSHDLQEPLRTMTSYAQLLARRYKGKLDEQANQFIQFINEGVSRMQVLITGLLNYAQATDSQSAFRHDSLSLEDSLREALQNLGASINQTAAVITHGPLPTVAGAPPQMTQIFQNLIGNALKYRKEGEAPEVHISAERRPGEWVLSVRDHGIGFDPQQAKRIFGVFQRLHKKEYEGTGIGLAICKRIIEQAGGRIWAEGSPGQGAVFHFTLSIRPRE